MGTAMRSLIVLFVLLLPAVAGAQITDKTQTSAPNGLNAASTTWAGCVFPPSVVASCVKIDYQGYQGVAALLKGTWAGTIVGGISADDGTTVTDVNLISSAGVSAATVTAAGLYNPNTVSGARYFLIRVSVYTSGSVDVVLRGTSAQARGTPTGGGAPLGGSGTLNNLAKFTPDGSTVGNSLLTDDGTNVSLPSGGFREFGSAILYTDSRTNSSGSYLLSQTTVKPAAPTGALAGAGAGNVDNGTHVYCVTFITATGETDCSTSSSAVTVVDKTANGQVTVSFTASSFSGVTGRNVYRSKAGTTTPIFLVATSPVVANNTATTYTDNIADASLTATTAPSANTTLDARITVANTGVTTVAGLAGTGTRCVNVTSAGVLGAAAADCVTSVAFSAITGGTNTTAAMIVGTGGSLTVSGSGTINATTLNGATFSAPGAIGGGTPSTGAFTTISASGQITSTVSTGSAPFVVASTTVVANLNASALGGATFAAPGAIGGGTPSTGAFTTVTGTSFQGIIGNVTPAAGTFTTLGGTIVTASTRFTPIAGTVAAAAYSFAGETNTGFSNENAGTLDIAVTGTQHMRITSNLIRIGAKVVAMSSSGSFSGADTGISVVSAGVVGVGTGGAASIAGGISLATILASGAVTFSGLTAASGTPSSICQNAATKEITVNAALTCTVSSRRFKEGIVDQGEALPLILAMQPREFSMKDLPGVRRVGFIAEEMENVDPRFVAYDSLKRPHSVHYEDLTSVLVKGIQEMARRIEVLEAR